MKKRLIFLAALLVSFSFSGVASAENSLDAVINEVAWMGKESSSSDEWVELYNNTGADLELGGWVLKAGDGKPEIKLSGIIPANGFYLLERTDDSTLPDIKADKIYTGALSNEGESLALYDDSGNEIDKIACQQGWFKGKTRPDYRTMERINSLTSGDKAENWQNSYNSEGTPRAKNSQGETAPQETSGQQEQSSAKENGHNQEKKLASISGQFPKTPSSVTATLLTALAIAGFSCMIILFIKIKLKNKV